MSSIIDEGMWITFRPDALDKSASYRPDWESKKGLKELVQDYEFKVVVDESDDLYATMDFFDKLLKVLQNVSWKEVAATSAEEVLKTLPMIVGTIIAVSAVLIALSMTPIGLLVSMLTPVVGAVMQAYAGANAIDDIANEVIK